MKNNKKIIAVLPAYNAEKTLKETYDEVSKDWVDEIILVDDASSDNTLEVARNLGLEPIVHQKNLGYGANQKTCYKEALKKGADIVIMIHPDHQYNPKLIPRLLKPLINNECEAVFGSRMLGGKFFEGGMPKWKFLANVLLTAIENMCLYMYLTECHSGFRAYSRRYLENVNFELNSNNFVFDTEIIVQGVICGMKIQEIPIETRYFDQASQVGFWRGVRYGLAILKTMIKYKLHMWGLVKFRQFS